MDNRELLQRLEDLERKLQSILRQRQGKKPKRVRRKPDQHLREVEQQLEDGDGALICQFLPRDKTDTGDPDNPVPPKHSTNSRPGSLEKIAVLAARFAANEELWHPSDAVDLTRIQRQPNRILG